MGHRTPEIQHRKWGPKIQYILDYLHIESKQQTTQSMFMFIFLYFNKTYQKLEDAQLNIQNKNITGLFRYHIS